MQVLNIMTGMTTTTMALKNFNIIIEMLKKRRDVTKKKKNHISTLSFIFKHVCPLLNSKQVINECTIGNKLNMRKDRNHTRKTSIGKIVVVGAVPSFRVGIRRT